MDEDAHIVTRRGDEIALSPTEYKLLRFLMRNAGRAMSRGQIIDHVWDYDFDGESTVVETFVSSLRKKVESPGSTAHPHRTRASAIDCRQPTHDPARPPRHRRRRPAPRAARHRRAPPAVRARLARPTGRFATRCRRAVAASQRARKRLDPTAVREPTRPTGHPVQRALRRADHGRPADRVRRPRGRGGPNARDPGARIRPHGSTLQPTTVGSAKGTGSWRVRLDRARRRCARP